MSRQVTYLPYYWVDSKSFSEKIGTINIYHKSEMEKETILTHKGKEYRMNVQGESSYNLKTEFNRRDKHFAEEDVLVEVSNITDNIKLTEVEINSLFLECNLRVTGDVYDDWASQ